MVQDSGQVDKCQHVEMSTKKVCDTGTEHEEQEGCSVRLSSGNQLTVRTVIFITMQTDASTVIFKVLVLD